MLKLMKAIVTIGHPPVLPEFASGYWQCKNRYRNQTEVLGIAQGYLNRSLPISVIVVDYLHWIYLGKCPGTRNGQGLSLSGSRRLVIQSKMLA